MKNMNYDGRIAEHVCHGEQSITEALVKLKTWQAAKGKIVTPEQAAAFEAGYRTAWRESRADWVLHNGQGSK